MIKKAILALTLLTLASCGKIETPQEFFDIHGDSGRDGTNGTNGKDGQDGTNGSNGTNGTDGTDGTAGATGEQGVAGIDGIDGQDGSIIKHVEVCNDNEDEYVETLVLLNGRYMAFLTDKKHDKQRLILLPEYVTFSTSDGRKVLFTIEDGELICL